MKLNINKKNRQNTRRRRYARHRHSNGNYLETLITQSIVCGIILAMVLIVRIIEVPQTAALRYQLRRSIATNIDMTGEARNLGAMLWAALSNTDDEDDYTAVDYGRELPVQVNTNAPEGDFRIDEDILREIQDRDRGGL